MAKNHLSGKRVKIYLVGGAVRDALLGLPCQDQDFMVVGTTPGVYPSEKQTGICVGPHRA